MDTTSNTKAKSHLHRLCDQIPNRRVGSDGNQQATDFFAGTVRSFGFEVECPSFDCMDWHNDGATLFVGDRSFNVFASPYTLGAKITAPLVVANSMDDLEILDLSNRIVLMRGELTKEQFLPKNFPFFQVEEQQKAIRLLETKNPQGIITATIRNPEMAGALNPFPVFEDGDFDIPSMYMTEEEASELAMNANREVAFEVKAKRIRSRGSNVVARKGNNTANRMVIFAHIDAKLGTPGALDNGTGIVTLLLLAELLKDYRGNTGIEIVALNGEDYYSSPGEQLYLATNEGKFQNIILGINIDGLGYTKGRTAYSFYECPVEMIAIIKDAFSDEATFLQGEPWFQGDHAIFLMNQRPALAMTSELVHDLLAEYVHTERDTPEIIDLEKVARTASALYKVLMQLTN